MRRALSMSLALVAPLILVGCPIYPEEPYGCTTSADCGQNRACDLTTGECYVPKTGTGGTGGGGTGCTAPGDCGLNETCSKNGQCRIGDCSFHGCVTGYSCDIADGTYTCVAADAGAGGQGGSAGASGSGGQGGTDAGQAGADSGTDGGTDAAADAAADATAEAAADAASDGAADASAD